LQGLLLDAVGHTRGNGRREAHLLAELVRVDGLGLHLVGGATLRFGFGLVGDDFLL
jgi:hypothetical protein